ncbi:hypothetical protein NM208_g7064 [Fusarium decemcellulare]|uniref:Uncharacterized protein n=1 Tax=Fusarium decemcellulare TaxID=57161 RepID=A0ACC1SAP3_9HYPO|nr:hypothetical protein NM208_g7064 [Fusarium decemcellulare]
MSAPDPVAMSDLGTIAPSSMTDFIKKNPGVKGDFQQNWAAHQQAIVDQYKADKKKAKKEERAKKKKKEKDEQKKRKEKKKTKKKKKRRDSTSSESSSSASSTSSNSSESDVENTITAEVAVSNEHVLQKRAEAQLACREAAARLKEAGRQLILAELNKRNKEGELFALGGVPNYDEE